ncbi:DUF6221 family protein [Streptomyces sp. WAC01280]|uniref:DUF6221 family protein n=1 Tax=Streptomyces sp. WAC01280 TaxID=2487424 RepID=UPI000F76ADB3|nr:DUF6221 family protein [Streptomyces sp. WAC01280]RSS59771.1 hypothetical protein EF909_07880 [Streptomyces sp. WAC01280]
MDDLIAFLRARLDEQEGRARALPVGPWQWRTIESGAQYDELVGPTGESVLVSSDTENYCSWISRHDAFDAYLQDIQPARVLAEVDAKRRILTAYENYDNDAPELDVPESVLRMLALSYADHPDYKGAWRP